MAEKITLREYLDALSRLPQSTRAADELPRALARMRSRLDDAATRDADEPTARDARAAIAYATRWSELTALEFLAEADVARERGRGLRRRGGGGGAREGIEDGGNAVVGLDVVDVTAVRPDNNPNAAANNRAMEILDDALDRAEAGDARRGGTRDDAARVAMIIALADRRGRSPLEKSESFADGLAKGDDAMLSVDFPNGTCVECEVDVLSVAPRLTVRCRARRTRDRDELARAAKQTVGLRAWRLDRLAYRNVYARRVRAIAALVEPPIGGVDAVAAPAAQMAGFSAELRKLMATGEDAMRGRKEKGARVDAGVRAVVLAGWGGGQGGGNNLDDVQADEAIAFASAPPSGVTPYASPLAALEALEEEAALADEKKKPQTQTRDDDRRDDPRDSNGTLRTLNGSQRAAVALGLAQRFTLVQGPPGTGKTYTAVALTKAWLAHGLGPVLCCSESNVAVDNVLDGLLAAGVPAIRIGRPEAIRGELAPHVAKHEGQVRSARAVCCTCSAAGGDLLENTRFGAVLLGAFVFTLVPIRPRRRGECRFLRTFAGVSLRPGSLAFNTRPHCLSTPLLTPLNSTPTFFARMDVYAQTRRRSRPRWRRSWR